MVWSWVENEPVLAVCGPSGSGKTTVLERVARELAGEGLSIGAVKHDAHGFTMDRPGKDSDRLYSAGAEVVLRGPEEVAARSRPGPHTGLEATLLTLLSRHDVVLVEGHTATPLPKVWLPGPRDEGPPDGVEGIVAVPGRGTDRTGTVLRIVRERVTAAWRSRPVFAGLLVGGASVRMGSPKPLVEVEGRTLAEAVHDALEARVDRVVLLGEGGVAARLRHLPRLPDAPGVVGPLAGILAALRWAPRAAWLIAACDLPFVTRAAVEWLLDQRRPGRRGVVPLMEPGKLEPLLAVYEPHAAPAAEALAVSGRPGPHRLGSVPGFSTPEIPRYLRRAWWNVNTPGDLEGPGAERA